VTHVKLRREARNLKQKALSSLRRGLLAFNAYDDDGRITTVLLHFQHCCEMLTKAALVQRRENIFDASGRTFSLEKCANLAKQHCGVTEGEAGLMRAIDSLRNAEQHWFLRIDEDVLYLHARALVTTVDDILKRSFEDDLSGHLPSRVLPVSTQPPSDIDFIVDREFKEIGELLTPGRRARDEARGRIRALLAMESHVTEEVAVSEIDITRIEKAIRVGKQAGQVFPRLRMASPGGRRDLASAVTRGFWEGFMEFGASIAAPNVAGHWYQIGSRLPEEAGFSFAPPGSASSKQVNLIRSRELAGSQPISADACGAVTIGARMPGGKLARFGPSEPGPVRRNIDHCNRLDRAVGVSGLRAFSEGYHDTAEATQPTAVQSTAHTPNDRNNTAVIDSRSNQ
jgi:hypothetical protein